MISEYPQPSAGMSPWKLMPCFGRTAEKQKDSGLLMIVELQISLRGHSEHCFEKYRNAPLPYLTLRYHFIEKTEPHTDVMVYSIIIN